MDDEPQIKFETDHEDIMKFMNIGGEEVGSDLDLSEDGASSIASSAELKFENPDEFGFDNSMNYNWLPADAFAQSSVQDPALDPGFRFDYLSPEQQHQQSQHSQHQHSQQQQHQQQNQHSQHPTQSQDLIQRIKFGAFDSPKEAFHPPEPETDLLKFDRSQAHHLAYSLEVDDFPPRSRVETQIKCRLTIRSRVSAAPSKLLLHLPSDTIARPRFRLLNPDQLKRDDELRRKTLWLSVEAINPDMPFEQVLMCPKCLGRERRRAFRKKAMDPHEETYWNGLQARRILIFNCREVVAINGEGQVELPLRIACYCRHHAAKNGYQLIFALRDETGQILGITASTNVFITDSHKDQRRVVTTSQPSPATSIPTTPSSVSSQDSSLGSSHIRRASSSSSLASSHSQQNHHPYARPANNTRNTSSTAGPSSTTQQFQQVPSSQLARQIQNLHAVPSWLAGVQLNDPQPPPQLHQPQPQQQQQQPPLHQIPTIFRAIPSSGSVRGGIEVTLLGQNFRSGLVAVFGEAQSVNTQCWSDSTLIAQLPPSSQPGPVPITFFNEPPATAPPTFTYVNDGEDKLKEIALQMIGYKVTGKIEDAADIAQRIIMNDAHKDQGNGGGGATGTSGGTTNYKSASFNEAFTDSAEQLALWVLHNLNKIGPGRAANLNLRNTEGQGMIHLASMLGYASIVKALIANGAYVDIQDVSGYTPLHFAVLFGNRNITRLLLMADADPFHRTLNGLTAHDLTDATVEDLLPRDPRAWFSELNRRGSSSSIASMVEEWRQAEMPPTPESSSDLQSKHMRDSRSSSFSDAESPYAESPHTGSPHTGSSHTSADNLGSSVELGPHKPPSYSQLYPISRESTNPTELGEAVSLPSEEDEREENAKSVLTNRAQRDSRRIIDIEVSNSEDGEEHEEGHAAGSGATTSGAEDISFVDPPTAQQQVWNDKMLFTFWIPLSLLTIVGITVIYIVQNYGRMDAPPLAIKLGDFVMRAFSVTVDRIMPMPRWSQTPSHAMLRPTS